MVEDMEEWPLFIAEVSKLWLRVKFDMLLIVFAHRMFQHSLIIGKKKNNISQLIKI